MAKYELITSYAQAESLGIKPNDSIVNKVIDTSKKKAPYHVVGYIGPGDFKQGEITFDPQIKKYEAFAFGEDEPYYVHGINTRMAGKLVNHALKKGTKYELYEVKTSRTRKMVSV